MTDEEYNRFMAILKKLDADLAAMNKSIEESIIKAKAKKLLAKLTPEERIELLTKLKGNK